MFSNATFISPPNKGTELAASIITLKLLNTHTEEVIQRCPFPLSPAVNTAGLSVWQEAHREEQIGFLEKGQRASKTIVHKQVEQ
jgi:hypothetical protein